MVPARLVTIQLRVADVKWATRFYAEGLGMKIKEREDTRTVIEAPGFLIEIDEVPPDVPLGARLVFEVEDPLEARRNLHSAGAPAKGPAPEAGDPTVGTRDPTGLQVLIVPQGGVPVPRAEEEPALSGEAPTVGAAAPAGRGAGRGQAAAAAPDPQKVQAREDEIRKSTARFGRALRRDIAELQNMLMGSATGRMALADHDPKYKKLYETVHEEFAELQKRGAPVRHKNPHDSLLSFFRHWSRALPSVGKKQEYVDEIYRESYAYVDKLLAAADSTQPLDPFFGGKPLTEPLVYRGDTVLHYENPFTKGAAGGPPGKA